MRHFNNHSDWYLDDNGVSVVGNKDEQIADLHNEYEVTGIKLEQGRFQIDFTKVKDYTDSQNFEVGQTIHLVINGVAKVSFPKFRFPLIFEGIYDIEDDSLSLCVGEKECYPIKGEGLQLSLET